MKVERVEAIKYSNGDLSCAVRMKTKGLLIGIIPLICVKTSQVPLHFLTLF